MEKKYESFERLSPAAPATTSAFHWFLRGVMAGLLISAALNATSYFFRSEGGGNLLGTASANREAFGFPREMWEAGNQYDGYFVDVGPLAVNLLCGLALGSLCGSAAMRFRRPLDRIEQELERTLAEAPRRPFQISLRGLMLATGLAALVAGAARYAMAGRAEVLGLFYLLGPWGLVTAAFLPLGLHWKQRVYVVIPVTFLLMAGGIAVGRALSPPLEFDKVLLGTFICWTPQSVLAATVITVVMLWPWIRRERWRANHGSLERRG